VFRSRWNLNSAVRAEASQRDPRPLPRSTRWLAVVAGLVAAVAFFGYGLPGLFIASMPIVGASTEPYIGRPGKWLLIAGALNLTVVGTYAMVGHALALRSAWGADWDTIAVGFLLTVSVVLIGWCDVVLIIHFTRSRQSVVTPPPPDVVPLRWLVWLDAFFGTALFFPEAVRECIRTIRHGFGSIGGPTVSLVLFPALVLLIFDIALVANAVRSARLRRID
jgi:hypothetical protein